MPKSFTSTKGGGGGITNSAGNNVVTKSDGTNLVASQMTDDGTTVKVGTTAAGTGLIGLPNNKFIYSRNAANSADLKLLGINASNEIEIGSELKWSADGANQFFQTTTAADGAYAAFGKRHYGGASVMSTDGTFSVHNNGWGFTAFQVIASYSGSSPVGSITPGADAQIGLRVKQASGTHSGNLTEWTDSGGTTILSRVNKAGYYMTKKNAAPADGDIATSELAIWFDNTSGAAKIKFKGKDSGGTVRTGEVALT